MTIDLKKLHQQGFDDSFQTAIIAPDRSLNDQLEMNDLEIFYGKTTTAKFYPQLERAIQENNPK